MTVTRDELPEGLQTYQRPTEVRAVQVQEPTDVQTAAGLERADPGDWVLIGADGYPFVMSDGAFRRGYPAPEGAAIGTGAEPQESTAEESPEQTADADSADEAEAPARRRR